MTWLDHLGQREQQHAQWCSGEERETGENKAMGSGYNSKFPEKHLKPSTQKTRLLQRRREELLHKGHNTMDCSELVGERSKPKVVSQLADVKAWNLQAQMVQVKPWPYELGFIGSVPLLKN